jgi:VIT1/CCC1 family predicted Fe2+/Mn2+ transporter
MRRGPRLDVVPERDGAPAPPRDVASRGANLREVIMGAQDNLTTVLAVVLGVAIGSGELRTIALAGLAAGTAEAISMAGVLYTATRAERDLGRASGEAGDRSTALSREPLLCAAVTFAAAIVAAAIPLAPFAILPVRWATLAAAVLSVVALFGLGVWTGTVTADGRWRGGLRFVLIGGIAALGAALVGAALRVDAA